MVAVLPPARSRDPKEYQTPYGSVRVTRYVYQSPCGGRIYCPLEHQARIIRDATPRFASQLSHKYAHLQVRAVQCDLEQNHGRKVATSYIQNVAEWVGHIASGSFGNWIRMFIAPIGDDVPDHAYRLPSRLMHASVAGYADDGHDAFRPTGLLKTICHLYAFSHSAQQQFQFTPHF
ncbi:hypothetical protein CCP4SC76_7560003 [Gammaproteobacteria bacterium]